MFVKIGKYKRGLDKRKCEVHVNRYDLWNLDMTLALVIKPSLVAFRNNLTGAPYVDNEDLPKHLQGDINPDTDWQTHEDRWCYVLDEMIYAFDNVKDCCAHHTTPTGMRVANGLRLFGKYYTALWQ